MLRSLSFSRCLTFIGAALAAVGLSACGAPADVSACECPDDQGCTYGGACLDRCSGDTECGTCGMCQLGLCVSTSDCKLLLTVSPLSITIPAGDSADVDVSLQRGGGFAEPVLLSLAGSVPAGLSASFNPSAPTDNASVLTLSVSPSAVSTTADVVIRGQGPGVLATTLLSVQITGATNGFELVGPATAPSVSPGGTVAIDLGVTRFGGNVEAITLSVTASPAGFVAEFYPHPVQAQDTAVVMSLAVPADATLGTANLTLSGSTPTAATDALSLAVTVQALSIAGRVVGADGAPEAGAMVALNQQLGAGEIEVTDTDGLFTFDAASAPYTLTVASADQLNLIEIADLSLAQPVI
ncbi:MAG: carboxypeptidase-like regulatory domain-containing protein, partial [Acidobacteriota bacterium]